MVGRKTITKNDELNQQMQWDPDNHQVFPDKILAGYKAISRFIETATITGKNLAGKGAFWPDIRTL